MSVEWDLYDSDGGHQPGVYPVDGSGENESLIVSLGRFPAESAPPALYVGDHGVRVLENETGAWLLVHVTTNPTDGVIDHETYREMRINVTEPLDPGLHEVSACVDGEYDTEDAPDLPIRLRGQLQVDG